METVRIQDGKKSDPEWKTYPGWKKVGSGINIPDPQHCWYGNTFTFHISTNVFFSLESPDEACGRTHTRSSEKGLRFGIGGCGE